MEWKQQSTGASKDGKTFKLKLITVSLYNIFTDYVINICVINSLLNLEFYMNLALVQHDYVGRV